MAEAPPGNASTNSIGQYDVRKGAGAYSPIVATYGALAIPAVTILFSVSSTANLAAKVKLEVILAGGLLVLATIGSIVGALGLAAISAEKRLTANLPPAIMYIAVPAALSIISVFAAFEVLAAMYLPSSRTPFVLVVGGGGGFAALLTAYAVGDSWNVLPSDQKWIKTPDQAYRNADIIGVMGIAPVLLGIIVRMAGLAVPVRDITVEIVVYLGIVLSLAGGVLSMRRTVHPVVGPVRSLRAYEAIGCTLTIGLFTMIVVLLLP